MKIILSYYFYTHRKLCSSVYQKCYQVECCLEILSLQGRLIAQVSFNPVLEILECWLEILEMECWLEILEMECWLEILEMECCLEILMVAQVSIGTVMLGRKWLVSKTHYK